MKKVNLIVQSGELVVQVLIPEFLPNQHPDCIIWGSRFFFCKGDINIYVEGFAIVAVTKTDDIVGDTKNIASKGNDNLLFGLPKTLDEASDDFLAYFSTYKDFEESFLMKEDEFVSYCHHASGQYLRNTYFLWWYPDHGYAQWPETKPEIVQYFNNLGITHADDMSSIILKTAWRKRHNEPVLEHQQAIEYKNHWKKNGFSDGIFKPIR